VNKHAKTITALFKKKSAQQFDSWGPRGPGVSNGLVKNELE